jgi:transcriptional regulator with XRE-family HTH domain
MRKIPAEKRGLIASIIRDYRIDRGITQEALAREIKGELADRHVYSSYNRTSVNIWEKGRAIPDLRIVSVLAEFAKSESIKALFTKVQSVAESLYEK